MLGGPSASALPFSTVKGSPGHLAAEPRTFPSLPSTFPLRRTECVCPASLLPVGKNCRWKPCAEGGRTTRLDPLSTCGLLPESQGTSVLPKPSDFRSLCFCPKTWPPVEEGREQLVGIVWRAEPEPGSQCEGPPALELAPTFTCGIHPPCTRPRAQPYGNGALGGQGSLLPAPPWGARAGGPRLSFSCIW